MPTPATREAREKPHHLLSPPIPQTEAENRCFVAQFMPLLQLQVEGRSPESKLFGQIWTILFNPQGKGAVTGLSGRGARCLSLKGGFFW